MKRLLLGLFKSFSVTRLIWELVSFYFPLSTFVSCRRRTGTAELCLAAADLNGGLWAPEHPTRPTGWGDQCCIMEAAWPTHGLIKHRNGPEKQPIMSIRLPGLRAMTNPPLGVEKSTHSSIMMAKLGSTLEMTRPTSFASTISQWQLNSCFNLGCIKAKGEVSSRIPNDHFQLTRKVRASYFQFILIYIKFTLLSLFYQYSFLLW